MIWHLLCCWTYFSRMLSVVWWCHTSQNLLLRIFCYTARSEQYLHCVIYTHVVDNLSLLSSICSRVCGVLFTCIYTPSSFILFLLFFSFSCPLSLSFLFSSKLPSIPSFFPLTTFFSSHPIFSPSIYPSPLFSFYCL